MIIEKVNRLKSGFIKKTLGILGATGLLLTFEACYGTPKNLISVQGKVSDAETEKCVEGIKISYLSENNTYSAYSSENGDFIIMLSEIDEILNISINDIDGEINGNYKPIDTTIILNDDDIFLDIKINKQS